MNSIAKQCIINQLNLHYDVKEVIKSFCFYDIKTWEIIQIIKNKKQEIDFIFKYEAISRATEPSQFYSNDDHDEHWYFGLENECQFQGANCTVCGNYLSLYSPNYISQKIVCNCQNDHEDFDDFTYISGYTDYTDGTDW